MIPEREVDDASVRVACEICGATSQYVGTKSGSVTGRVYEIRQCPKCWFVMVADPWTDFEQIYNEDYYLGRGADRLIHYLDETVNVNRTIRRHEWRGIVSWANSINPLSASARWLDYGCGAGGLVMYLRGHGVPLAEGFEQGWAETHLLATGVPRITADDFASHAGVYDIVSMIEVLEHLLDPVEELKRIRSLLRPGGLLLLTTGNAEPYRRKIVRWRYLLPDIHISLFEPETLRQALSRSGFEALNTGFGPGWQDMIRFKILKNGGLRYLHRAERLVPWWLVSRLADYRWGLSAHPIGRIPIEEAS